MFLTVPSERLMILSRFVPLRRWRTKGNLGFQKNKKENCMKFHSSGVDGAKLSSDLVLTCSEWKASIKISDKSEFPAGR